MTIDCDSVLINLFNLLDTVSAKTHAKKTINMLILMGALVI